MLADDEGAEFRASVLHNFLECIEAHADGPRILASLPPGLRSRAEGLTGREWISVTEFVPVYRVVWGHFGPEGYCDFFRQLTVSHPAHRRIPLEQVLDRLNYPDRHPRSPCETLIRLSVTVK